MLTREEIFKKIQAIIAEQLNLSKDAIAEQSTLDSLGADSLDRFEFIMKLEEEFGITIKDEDADAIANVGQAIDYVFTLKNQAQ